MTAVIDTGPLVALANARDPQHERARRVMRRVLGGTYGAALSLDLVLLEGLTLIQRRANDPRISELFASYFHGAQSKRGPLVQMRPAGDLIERAVELHFQHYDRRLSTVDAALVAVTNLTTGVLVTFERGFEGIVPTVRE